MHNDYTTDHTQTPYGSARWTDEAEIADAGLFKPSGLKIGFIDQKPLYQGKAWGAGHTVIAGSGAGKLTTHLAYSICLYPGSCLGLDPKGEIAAISLHNQVRMGKKAWVFNPYGLHDLPRHRLNPLDILKPDSPTLHAYTATIILDLMPSDPGVGGSQKYWEDEGRRIAAPLMIGLVELQGGVSLSDFHSLLFLKEADQSAFLQIMQQMQQSRFADVRSVAFEIESKLTSSDMAKQMNYFFSEITRYMAFLNDPVLKDAVSGDADVSLEALTQERCNIYVCIPASNIETVAPLLRLIFSTAMLYKSRVPQAPKVLLLVDEAAQLGTFSSLKRAIVYGRGAGIVPLCVFQDIGQIRTQYGHHALSTFLGSSTTQVVFGVRDLESAEYFSRRLGVETLSVPDRLQQEQAKAKQRQVIHGAFMGSVDPFQATMDAELYEYAKEHHQRMARPLMTPSEILAMPEDRQLVFLQEAGCPNPILANRYPYWTRKEMTGCHFPNPYHGQSDRVTVPGGWFGGSKALKVITEAVPTKYAHYPQYQTGKWKWIEGYRPK